MVSPAAIMLFMLKWTEVFEDPEFTLDSLNARAFSRHSNLGMDGIRSVCWKVYLSCLPSLEISTWPLAINTERERYVELRRKYIRAIGSDNGPDPDLEVNNPLSLAEDSPWQQFFMDSELRKIIKQDVERTLPDIDYFRLEKVQEQLNDILFIYCKINHDVSYRQGMHELVAHVLWVVSSESLDVNTESSTMTVDPTLDIMKCVLDPNYVEHDTFALFSNIMKHAKPWYEFSDEATPSKRRPKLNANHQPQLFGRSETPEPPPGKQTPVIEWSMKIFHHLERIDNELFLHLKSHDIQPQLFGIRWFRLLFGREFPMDDVLILWDGIFAKDPGLEICIFIGLAMLLQIRDDLLEQDFAGCLHKLMRYPSVKDVQLFIPQALSLQKQPNAAGGYEIISQNSVLAGKPLPALPPEATDVEHDAQNQHHTHQQQQRPRNDSPSPYSRQSSYQSQPNQHPYSHHGEQSKGHSAGFSSNGVFSQHLPPAALGAIKPVAEGFANVTKNVLESKGGVALNKAINDMKKNTQSYIRKANAQSSSPPDTGFPPNIEQAIASSARGTPSHHPVPPQQKNQSSHVNNSNPDKPSNKKIQLQLGQIVAKALAILDTELVSAPTDDDSSKTKGETQANPKTPSKAALAAISGLEHVRDILLGFSKDLNPDVIESKMLDSPVSISGDISSTESTQGTTSIPSTYKPLPDTPGVAATSGVQQRMPANATTTSSAVTKDSNSSSTIRSGSPALPIQDHPSHERRNPSQILSHSVGVHGQNEQEHRFNSHTPTVKPTSSELHASSPSPPASAAAPAAAPPPSISVPEPVPAPVRAPTPKPFSFDDLIDDTPDESVYSSSPSLSAPRGPGVSGIPSRFKPQRSSLTHSQFSWILNQDSNRALATGLSIAGGSIPSSMSSSSLSVTPKTGIAGAGIGGGMRSSVEIILPSTTSRVNFDPLAGSVDTRVGSGSFAPSSGLTSVISQQRREDDPLRS
ncbi:hypothetical protein BGZ65_002973 [Modicella reniformis]|uniref:Rab-GAP TBC domain-containing protein n=1 Tax=Modicella reniformis TaxID=1440133 RepID=A0A9P6MC40_9FUNG|nr:hypothetical protein BGZ65_002973 [Modicella reniformis]